ncbi:hypothetical protein QAD02_006349 [Eretmocerus hayati]|uniref:Uncharacterized protein n=1 Tax=Eretmocerus hayati TaxID=131215 RepID=A0ACC2N105_9HYME|nr:hypothetical protein QAD02_006349 [Eretmocerus hayati]
MNSPIYFLAFFAFAVFVCMGAEINQHNRVTRSTDIGDTVKKFVQQIGDGISDETQRAIEFGMRIAKEVLQVIRRVFSSEEYKPFIDETARQIADGAQLAAELGHKLAKGIMRGNAGEIDDESIERTSNQDSSEVGEKITQDI